MPQEELSVHLEKLQWECVLIRNQEILMGHRSRQGMIWRRWFWLQGLHPVLVEWSPSPVLSPLPCPLFTWNLQGRCWDRAGEAKKAPVYKHKSFSSHISSYISSHLILPSSALPHLPQPSLQFPRSFLCFWGFSAALHHLSTALHPECPGLTLRLFCSWSGAVHTGTGHCCPGLAWGVFVLLGKGLINELIDSIRFCNLCEIVHQIQNMFWGWDAQVIIHKYVTAQMPKLQFYKKVVYK